MQLSKNIYYYFSAVLLFVILKFLHSFASNDVITLLTKPTSAIITLITNTSSVYNSNTGFYIEKLNIVIDKSCSGFNFWILCFILCFYILLKSMRTTAFKVLLFPISLIIAYLVTLFVNTSRILISLFIEHKTNLHYKWLHQAEGIFIYLSFLILFFFIINYLQAKYLKNYEKLT